VTGGASKLAEARYGVVPGKEIEGLDAAEPVKEEGPRKPLESKKRAPLKRN
jgi:hypothetical protein